MKKSILILLIFFNSILSAQSGIIFSEIMFQPQTGNNEFIEIYNLSPTNSIDLSGYKIKYYTSNKDEIISAGKGMILSPLSFAVIFEGDYELSTGIYRYIVPENTLILKISDNSFGTSGMSNSSDRQILLFNSAGDTLDSHTYSANNITGYSDEKIILNNNDSDTNWNNSVAFNGTPGYKNSVTPKQYDLQITKFNPLKNYGLPGEAQQFQIAISNQGTNTVDDFSIEIYKDENFDSLGTLSEKILRLKGLQTNSSDTVNFNFEISNLSTGVNIFIAKLITDSDEDTSNNILYTKLDIVKINEYRNDLVVNEIMYAPEAPQPEWLEIYNKSSKAINLKNYQLADNNDTIKIVFKELMVEPSQFLVISSDSSIDNFFYINSKLVVANIRTLNNTGDKIILLDSLNRTIDSLEYSPAWGGTNGRSLERISVNDSSIDSHNWKSSLNPTGATPGFKNSVTPKDYDIGITEFSTNKKIGLLNEPALLKLIIKNFGKLNSGNFSVEVFNDLNNDTLLQLEEKVTDLSSNPLNPGDTAIFNFTISNLLEGKNILYVRINSNSDEDSTNNYSTVAYYSIRTSLFRNDIVINEIMYAPSSPEPEWIELFNNSSKTLNLQNLQLADNGDTTKIIFDSLEFLPNEYLILSADSSLLSIYNINSKFVVTKFPSLNNSSDKIILLDSLSRVIDSLEYSDNWGGTKGHSLERISVGDYSSNQTNWSTSASNLRGTPGKINSISKKDFDICLTDLVFSPAHPLIKDDVKISVLLKNIGKSIADFSVLLFEDTNQDSIPDLLLDNISEITILTGGSAMVNFNYVISELLNERSFIAEISYPDDQDSSNNFVLKNIKPGYESGSLAINEIMYNPGANQPEWIELSNSTNETLNLKNWKISNLLPEPFTKILVSDDYLLHPNGYLVVAPDSSYLKINNTSPRNILINNFGILSNTTDGIAIYDFRDTMIDSLIYNATWGGNNTFSLERISTSGYSNDSANWRSSISVNKNTAGFANSVVNLISYKRSSLIINEIMFDPGLDNSEFIEFLNISGDSINIGGWKVVDTDGHQSFISNVDYYLPAWHYYVTANDSLTFELYSIKNNFNVPDDKLSLSNSGERLILKDVKGNTIDSLVYSADWHNRNFVNTKNRSLERITPYSQSTLSSNWNSSVSSNGATPGKENSIFTKSIESTSRISISPNPFSPDNDGYEDYAIINYSLKQPIAQIRAEIFDSKGRHVRSLQNNDASGSNGSIIFDGLDDEHHPLRIGIYILLFEAVNENNGVIEQYKKAFVIARKL